MFKGGDRLQKRLAEITVRAKKAAALNVGFLSSAKYPDGTFVATIAAYQEFGAPAAGIPPRPFFRPMIEAKKDKWPAALGAALKAADYDSEKALGQAGAGIQGQLQKSITDTNSPPDSPVTDLLKQRFPMGGQTFDDVMQAREDVAKGVTAPASKPLVHTGVMLRSVNFEVITG